MTTTEKLQQIRARCVELLALAEKRTPGKWNAEVLANGFGTVMVQHPKRKQVATCWMPIIENSDGSDSNNYSEWDANRSFIAACAGAAESGWRSTIAAIDGLREMALGDQYSTSMTAAILAAWEGTL